MRIPRVGRTTVPDTSVRNHPGESVDLELTDDQQELRDNVRTVLEDACPAATVRALHEGEGDAAALWDTMAELYWPALGIDEAHGGLGLGFVEVALLAEELGRATAPGPLLATVSQFVPVVREIGGEPAGSLLSDVAAGTCRATVAWGGDGWGPDGVAVTATREGDGWRLDGTAGAVLCGADADRVAVVVRGPGTVADAGLGVVVVDPADGQVHPRPVLDPTLPLADIDLSGCVVTGGAVLAPPGTPGVAEAVERAGQEAAVAMALSTVGASRRIFELTVEYAKVREQYDRVIGSFQALKHRLADMYLAVERANAVGYYAALTIAEDDERRGEAAHLAKAAAGDCQRLLAEDGLQLHGGIGYTWEHDLHFLLKRAKAGEVLCGPASYHRARLAHRLGLTEESA